MKPLDIEKMAEQQKAHNRIIQSKVDEPCLHSPLISEGNIHDAMLHLDYVDARLVSSSAEAVIDALRYWMGEVFAGTHQSEQALRIEKLEQENEKLLAIIGRSEYEKGSAILDAAKPE